MAPIVYRVGLAIKSGALVATLAATDIGVRVSGEDLAWKVETPFLILDLARNPGTGRSGQINTIFLKESSVLLTRNRSTSTLHLSPNAAVGRNWFGVNRWDPPAAFHAERVPGGFRVEREGEMPNAKGLWVRTVYEFVESEPVIRVEETVETVAEAKVRLLRLCEWSFAPGAEYPFTHIAWEDAAGKIHLKSRAGEETAALDVRWQAFLNIKRRFGFAALVEKFDLGASPLLSNAASRFAGDPHYFYRALIANEEGNLMTIPRGQRYSIRYTVHCFRPEGENPVEALSRQARLMSQ